MTLDCVVRGGTVVTADAVVRADLGIRDGTIATVGTDLPPGKREIDASHHLVVPGAIDVHTHLSHYIESVDATMADDYESGTRAAAAGGVTCIVNFAFQKRGESLRAAVEREAERAREQAHIDYGAHITITDLQDPRVLDEIGPLADEGYASIKIFTVGANYAMGDRDVAQVLATCADNDVLVSVHAEDHELIAHLTAALVAQGKIDVASFPRSRPSVSEALAVSRVATYARVIGCPVYFVHLSSKDALDAVRRARGEGATVYVETRPVYLFLDSSRYDLPERNGAKYVCLPPLRAIEDQDALWAGLRNGEIQTYATDHSPWPLAKKIDPSLPFPAIPPGVPNLQRSIGMLYSEGVGRGRISLNQFVAVTATNPAKLFGLWPRKGTLAVGSDADLVLIDPSMKKRLSAADVESRVDYELYEGVECVGWPVLTMSRGDVVYEGGAIKSKPGRGLFVQRSRYQPL